MANAHYDLCYFAGAFRDGCLSSQWQVKIKQKSKCYLVDKIVPILNQEFDLDLTERAVYLQADENRRFYVSFKNKRVWEQIRKLFNIPSDTDLWNTPPFVTKLKKTFLRFYIQGFFDAEGGVPHNPMRSKLYISFTQRNRESLEFLKNRLYSRWGIVSGDLRVSDHKSHCWRFAITGQDSIKRFIIEIGTRHPSKKKRLDTMLNRLTTKWKI